MNKSVSAESTVHADTKTASDRPAPASSNSSEQWRVGFNWSWFLLALLLPILSMLPLLYLQAEGLIIQQSYMFFPLTTVLGISLLWKTCRHQKAGLRRTQVSVVGSWLGIAIGILGIYWVSPRIVHIGSVIVVFSWALGAFGGASWTRIVAICSLFAIAIPLPGGRDVQVNVGLQAIANWASNGFLDAIGIANITEGNVLQVVDKRISVSAVCGGADSVYALLAIALSIVVLRRCSLLTSLATLASVPFLILFGNTFRLLAIAIGFHSLDIDLSTGAGHIWTAVFVFAMSVLNLLLVHFAIAALFEPIQGVLDPNNLTKVYQFVMSWPKPSESMLGAAPDSSVDETVGSKWRSNFLVLGAPVLACLFFGILSAYAVFFVFRNAVAVQGIRTELVSALPSQDAFPNQFVGLNKVGFKASVQPGTTMTGRYSNLWKFDDSGNQVFASLNFPFQGWSPLWAGYQANGWTILETNQIGMPSDDEEQWTVEEFTMQNQYGLHGMVSYAFFGENGIPIKSPRASDQPSRTNIFSQLQEKSGSDTPNLFQVQVFFESGRKLTRTEIERNQKLFLEVFEHVRQQSEAAIKKAK